MMVRSDKDFFEDVANLAMEIKELANNAFPVYEAFTEDVVSGRIADINEIELTLDYMLTYCFDDKILSLYKKILRKLYKQYPGVVKDYVDIYYDMYKNDGDNCE